MILNDVVTKMLRSILLQRYAFFAICRNVFVFFVSNQGQKGLSFVSNHGQVEALMFQIRGKIVLVLSQIVSVSAMLVDTRQKKYRSSFYS